MEEQVSRTVVPFAEILWNGYNLNNALYMDTTEPEEPIDEGEELTKLRELQAERGEIESQLCEYMEVLGYE